MLTRLEQKPNCHRRPSPRTRLKSFLFGVIALSLLNTGPVTAQTDSDERLNTVLAILTSYLLDTAIFNFEFGKLTTESVTVYDDFTAQFETNGQDVELCFVVSSVTGFSVGDLVVTINGVTQTGSSRPSTGENCYTVPLAQQTTDNTISFSTAPGVAVRISHGGVESAQQSRLGLASLTRGGWDERAVRKVLKIFAFGGHATESQIREWSYMRPTSAINEMLNFSEHNLRLSPLAPGETYTEPATSHGTFRAFLEHIESPSSNIPIPVDEREYLGIDGYRFDSSFARMVVMRGLNPFRQRIGFWETNYHLAVNLDANVSRRQMVEYYDSIMEAHEARVPYHEIMGIAAKSAAAAMQYGHRRNRCVFRNGEWDCNVNQDLARELHQLYFGIFGSTDPNHEEGTINETAKMLTDMRVPYIEDFGFDTNVTFGTDYHHTDDLIILGQTISGVDASAKIDNLMPISIVHPESLENLPAMIISVLADDNLNEARRNQLRAAWAQLGPNKDFLTFIHAYAISEMFHGPEQRKYLTSFERAYYLANKFNIDNIEAYLSNDQGVGREIEDVMRGDNAGEEFRPLHNVFGGQNSQEASDSAVSFEKNFNRSATSYDWQFRYTIPSECEECDQGQPWSKDWSKVIPPSSGAYPADYVARWLWKHVVGNFDNYTPLERAHLLAILGSKRLPRADGTEYEWQTNHRYTYFDLNQLLCLREDRLDNGQTNNSLAALMSFESWNNYCDDDDDGHTDYSPVERAAFALTFNGNDLQNSSNDPFPYLRGLVQELATVNIDLTSSDPIQRRRANERLQAAMAFIFATPYVFAEGE